MIITTGDIIDAIESRARPEWQEDYDNTGWQILVSDKRTTPCHGVMLCIDVTPEIVVEAYEKECNLIIAHHPLFFRSIRQLDGGNRVGASALAAIRRNISIYSCHTSIDKAPCGVSYYLAQRMGLKNIDILSFSDNKSIGIGVIGDVDPSKSFGVILSEIKNICHSPVARCSGIPTEDRKIGRVAIGAGACADLIPVAVAKGAEIMITSDVKHNYFIDFNPNIAVVDLGHFETEECTKDIFYKIITEKFPNFVPCYSEKERNPIIYL